MGQDWLGHDFSRMLDTLAARYGKRAALHAEEGSREEDMEAVTFEDLRTRSWSMAGRLAAAGVTAGDRVALLAENSIAWVYAWFGSNLLGASVVPLNTKLTWREIEYQLAKAQPRLLLVDDPHPESDAVTTFATEHLVDSMAAEITCRWLRDVPGSPFPVLEAGTEDELPTTGGDRSGEVGMVQFTSGSTASPKGALLRQDAVIATGAANAGRWMVGVDDVFLGTSPFYHNSGAVFTLLSALLGGASVAITSRWSGDRAARMAHRLGVTVLIGVGTVLRDFVRSWAEIGAESQIRLVATAETPAFCRQVREALQAEITNVYGLTECSPTVALGDLRDPQEKRLQYIGRPHAGIDVRIVDDHGRLVPAGTPGEIHVLSWNRMVGYLGMSPDEQPFTEDGWLRTGDLGTLSADGYLQFHGRIKDVVKSGGENVSALEVEIFLKGHPSIVEAQIVGVEDPKWGEKVVAFVEFAPGSALTPEQLKEFCRSGLAAFKRPKEFIAVEQWPLTGSTKISKPDLRQRLTSSMPAPARQEG
ncbi:class I adenylate-forming enzyme family protein [Actinoplanes sp. NBRC 103695]|uniref:class I adenylate-forming enzyme family protein n=1 Tax=Actinoplanes sp. NBRC 103695 TaxID=3032202 RepID=UPI0024A1F46E|nr:class I adenylate-forming enzyme family protein [Actinoplanes sp. NBRC 103695]GLY97208.1 AMP-binding protein [Actinoplanes sp. NBRC 103695]